MRAKGGFRSGVIAAAMSAATLFGESAKGLVKVPSADAGRDRIQSSQPPQASSAA